MHDCNSESFNVSVNNVVNDTFELKQISFQDPVITGAQLLEKLQNHPIDNYIVLLQEPDGMLEDIGLGETFDISSLGERCVFVSEGDRLYNIKINGRRFPWLSDKISENTIRKVANIVDDHCLWLERQKEADLALNDSDIVNLCGSELETVYSAKQDFIIIINGRSHKVEASELTFLELVKLAFSNTTVCQNTAYTITYKRGCKDKPEGSMVQGDSVCLKNGEVFNVTATNKS